MGNIAKKAYILIKHFFCFGFDPIRFITFLIGFCLISTSVYFSIYKLSETLIFLGFLSCRHYHNQSFDNYTNVDIGECDHKNLQDSSRFYTISCILLMFCMSALSYICAQGENSLPFTKYTTLFLELRQIDEEEKKE